MIGRAAALLLLGAAGALLAGCALLAPLPKPAGVAERLAAFPTRGLPLSAPVTIWWSDRHIPFVEASADADAAFALGLVHAHLRLAQMSMARMIAYGRLSEIAGPLTMDIDRGLRILSYPRAAAASERAMDPQARRWTERFVEGINHYQAQARELPHEFAVLGLEREPWTVADILAVGRLVGTDVNWLAWLDLLPLRARADWPEIWGRLAAEGSASVPSFGPAETAALQQWLAGVSRSGSNSLAVAPQRTATGGALIANDPHLGLTIPSVWLIAGVKSPSYHAVGLMGPGLPIFAIGRNPAIAWGGTNMRAASSDLYDVSGLDPARITRRAERIRVRWWFDSEAAVRETPYGPIVSDAPQLAGYALPPLALKWTGHAASDEIGAMLAAARARNFDEFRAAFRTFAVPGQNMLYADADGNIGQVMAARLPLRGGPPADLVLDPAAHDAAWGAMRGSAELPFAYNPPAGFLASANNRPTAQGMPVGFFFSPSDRAARMAEVVEAETPIDLDTLKALQRDVYMASAHALCRLFLVKLDAAGLAAAAHGNAAEALRRMRAWDGHYRPDSIGAVAYEQFRHGFVSAFYAAAFGADDWRAAAPERAEPLLPADIEAAGAGALRAALAAGLETAAQGLGAFANWAAMHRLRLAHPLANLPLIGSRYRFAEYGVGGSSATLMKTAHDSAAGRHFVDYGANARHISDMSDPDANWFVLLGGQDGWLNSGTLLDQWPLWRDGEYVRVPLSLEEVRRSFPHRLTLEAAPPAAR